MWSVCVCVLEGGEGHKMSPMKEKRSSPSPASPQVLFHFLSCAHSFASLYRYINGICDCVVKGLHFEYPAEYSANIAMRVD